MKRVLLGIALLIAGCSLRAPPPVPEPVIPQNFREGFEDIQGVTNCSWWENFGDSGLNALVKQALLNNTNYQIALKNIDLARTYVYENEAMLFPFFNLSGSASRNLNSQQSPIVSLRSGLPYNLYQLAGSVSYEVDLWNKVGNAIAQAQAEVVVSEAASQIVWISLLSNLVTNYLQLVTLDKGIVNLTLQLKLAQELSELTQIQWDSGLIDIEPLEDAKILIENIGLLIQSSIKAREITLYTLAYLAGEYPETFKLPISEQSPVAIEDLVPSDIPSRVMARRPDIQQAYWQVVAFGYAEKQSIANFLPAISLTGNYGFTSTSLAHLIAGSSTAWNYGISLLQPVINYGVLNAQYEQAELQYEIAILSLYDTVKAAFEEVNSALVAYKTDYDALKGVERIVASYRQILEKADAQQQAGLIDGPTYITYELNTLEAEYQLINQLMATLADIVQIYKTLAVGLPDDNLCGD